MFSLMTGIQNVLSDDGHSKKKKKKNLFDEGSLKKIKNL